MSFHIVTDSNSDIPKSVRSQFENFSMLNVPFFLDDVEGDPDISYSEFFRRMREGAASRTAQINPPSYVTHYEELIASGVKEILYIALSSKLSGIYENSVIAANEVLKKHPDVKIISVDSISASVGMGLLVQHAMNLRDEGKTIEEVRDWLESNKHRVCHWFTVGDLNYLKRGGRLSASAAWFGTALNIKPVLHVEESGGLVPVEKKIGRKKAIQRLIDRCKETVIDLETSPIIVLHADVPDEAENLKDMVEEQIGTKNIVIAELGPVIGAHAGPGAIALIFMGSER